MQLLKWLQLNLSSECTKCNYSVIPPLVLRLFQLLKVQWVYNFHHRYTLNWLIQHYYWPHFLRLFCSLRQNSVVTAIVDLGILNRNCRPSLFWINNPTLHFLIVRWSQGIICTYHQSAKWRPIPSTSENQVHQSFPSKWLWIYLLLSVFH
jgi:hypothetical protein